VSARPVAPAERAARAAVTLDGRGLRPAGVAAVAIGGAPVRLGEEARARNAAARDALAALVAAGAPVYGVTTGVGALHDRRVAPDDAPEHQRRLLRSHAAGAGDPLEPEVVRAGMAVRLNQLGAGGAGASEDLLDALAAALGAGIVPVVRELGALGTGDLAPRSPASASRCSARARCCVRASRCRRRWACCAPGSPRCARGRATPWRS
jgi:histidine ammonia-lyase